MSLSKLIEAVEAGSRDNDFWASVHVLPATCITDVTLARDGSIDAAKRLHDALLPGWAWSIKTLATDSVQAWTDRAYGLRRRGYIGTTKDNPARAWLLAILRALEQEGGDG